MAPVAWSDKLLLSSKKTTELFPSGPFLANTDTTALHFGSSVGPPTPKAMPSPFAITAATNSIFLDDDRRSRTRVTVSNTSGRPLRGRARLVAHTPEVESWLRIEGDAERSFAIAGTEQYTILVDVPSDVPADNYSFRLDMVGEERPDEQYVEGPTVTFEVPETKPTKPFPTRIALIVLGVLLFGGLIAFLLWPREGTTHETVMLRPDSSLSVHFWSSRGGGSQFIDLDRYNYRAGVSRTEDLPPAGESISLLTFPSRELRNEDIAFVSLQLGTADVVGNPFARHGNLLIEEVSFADFNSAPYAAEPLTELFRMDRPPIQPEEGVADALEVTEALKASLDRGNQRFQLRLRFENVELEDVDAELAAPSSYVEWNHTDVHLRVTIREPYRYRLLW